MLRAGPLCTLSDLKAGCNRCGVGLCMLTSLVCIKNSAARMSWARQELLGEFGDSVWRGI